MKLTADPETMPSSKGIVDSIKSELNKVFKPAFLGRLVIIPYYPVRDENLKQIIRLKLNKVVKRMAENHRIELAYDPALVEAVASRCTEVESGARNVDNILTHSLLPDISRLLLGKMAEGEKITTLKASVDADGNFAYV
jgi:type VI secretion system protein VasG